MAEVDVISEVWETKHHIFILKDKQTTLLHSNDFDLTVLPVNAFIKKKSF